LSPKNSYVAAISYKSKPAVFAPLNSVKKLGKLMLSKEKIKDKIKEDIKVSQPSSFQKLMPFQMDKSVLALAPPKVQFESCSTMNPVEKSLRQRKSIDLPSISPLRKNMQATPKPDFF
jgi:hypothetical protein